MEGDAADPYFWLAWLFWGTFGLSVGWLGTTAILWLWGKMGIAFPPMGFFNRPLTIHNPSPTWVMAVGSAVGTTRNYPRGRYNLPPGWSYDAVTQRYEHISGLSVDCLVANAGPRGVYTALLDAQAAVFHYGTPQSQAQQQAQQQALTQQFNDMLPTTDTSELLRASEIVEQFESFMKSMGVKSPLKLPGEVFTRWLAYEAGVREDGDAISPTTREILIGLENHPAVVEQILDTGQLAQ